VIGLVHGPGGNLPGAAEAEDHAGEDGEGSEEPGRCDGAGAGVALVPGLALTGSPQVRDLQITPQLTRYIGAWLPRRHQPNPAAERLLAALRARAAALPAAPTGHR